MVCPGPCRIGKFFLFDLLELRLVDMHSIFLREEFEQLPYLLLWRRRSKRQACVTSIQHVLCSSFSLVWLSPCLLLSGWACVGIPREKFTKDGSPGLWSSVKPLPPALSRAWAAICLGHIPRREEGRVEIGACMENRIITALACILSPIQLSSNETMGRSW